MGKPGAPPGTRFGGRQKGTPNKDKRELRDMIRAAVGEWDPVVEMAKIAKTGHVALYVPDPTTGELVPSGTYAEVSDKTRQNCRKEVAEYTHPKLRAVEMSGPGGDPIEVTMHNDVRALDTLAAMLKGLAENA